MKHLTKIEQLDGRYPGLADKVRKWFAQGISAKQIVGLLFEQYQISLSPTPVSSFRSRRWVPEQELLRDKRISAMAAMEVAREQEIRASMVARVAGEMN
ncbi:MAG: hypothetical protein P4N24_17680 [Acidobacteriota bacterium]|nr:hypothetical protein [Acidobacteriota bacterium]